MELNAWETIRKWPITDQHKTKDSGTVICTNYLIQKVVVTVWWKDVLGTVSQQSSQRVVFAQVQILDLLHQVLLCQHCPAQRLYIHALHTKVATFLHPRVQKVRFAANYSCQEPFLWQRCPCSNPRDWSQNWEKKREERLSSEDMPLSNSSCLQNWPVDMNHNHNWAHNAGLQRCSIS
jgi:hypothetical protein